MMRRQRDELPASAIEKCIALDAKSASANLVERCEGRLEVVFAAGAQDMDSLPNRALRHLSLSGKVLGSRIFRIDEVADDGSIRHYVMQKIQKLRCQAA